MEYLEFLTKVVDTGIEAAKRDYAAPGDAHRLAGSIEGFEACRGKFPPEISDLLTQARADVATAYGGDIDIYWKQVCRAAEIEWTANVLSAILLMSGQPVIVPPTYRGIIHAYRLLGGKTP